MRVRESHHEDEYVVESVDDVVQQHAQHVYTCCKSFCVCAKSFCAHAKSFHQQHKVVHTLLQLLHNFAECCAQSVHNLRSMSTVLRQTRRVWNMTFGQFSRKTGKTREKGGFGRFRPKGPKTAKTGLPASQGSGRVWEVSKQYIQEYFQKGGFKHVGGGGLKKKRVPGTFCTLFHRRK
jgi:hypothetical protein